MLLYLYQLENSFELRNGSLSIAMPEINIIMLSVNNISCNNNISVFLSIK